MKRFQFPLDKLLRYHQQRQKQADFALSRASLEREQAEAAVQRLREEIASVCRLPEGVGRPIEPTFREQAFRRADQLCQTLQAAQEKLKAAQRRFREAQNARTAVTQEVEALLHLRSRQWDEHQDEATRRQQIELDDIVMKQWARDPSRRAALEINASR